MSDEAPTTEERYARASTSSHLKLRLDAPGDVDVITAAGLAPGIGAILLRLRREFDALRRPMLAARLNLAQRIRAANEAGRPKIPEGTPKAERAEIIKKARAEAERMRAEAEKSGLSDRLLVRGELRALSLVSQALGSYALDVATRHGLRCDFDAAGVQVRSPDRLMDEEIRAIVGQVVDAWVDRACADCTGRGMIGGYSGEPAVICRSCRGGGGRPPQVFSRLARGQALAERLLVLMDRATETTQRSMRGYLR